MSVQITCYPPLGQVTTLKDKKIKFSVLLELESETDSHSDEDWEVLPKSESDVDLETEWEVQIWHNTQCGEWTTLSLQECPSTAIQSMSSRQPTKRHVFEGELYVPGFGSEDRHASFTIRYKQTQKEEWRWVKNKQQLDDGELILSSSDFSASETSEEDISRYFDSLSPGITIGLRKSEAPGAALWHLSGTVSAAAGGESRTTSSLLGVPSLVSRSCALVRLNPSWLGPRQGKDKFEINEDAILCSFLRKDGIQVLLLALSLDDIVTTLGSGENGNVLIKSRNDSSTASHFQVLAAAATDFEIALGALIYEARKLVRPFDAAIISKDDVDVQWQSGWLDGLTYCTWNGLGQDLSEEKILSAFDDLESQGISISNLIIDDNWQSLDNEGSDQSLRGLKEFEADPKAFPHGLAKTVSTIREKHPNIKHIAVWHALFGYWGGISPDGELARRYKTKRVPISTQPYSLLAIAPSDIHRFYNDFYVFLLSCGITGTKADAQSTLDLLSAPTDRTSFLQSYLSAQSISSLRHFSANTISSMSLFPQTIFASHLPPTKPSITLRNSDDFFPDNEDSHAWHIFANGHNALLSRYLNVTPDWDMFMSRHPWGAFHAAGRCLSGGPIAITDRPGEHDIGIIKQICARTPQGTTTIIRTANVGRVLGTGMYNGIDDGSILQIGTFHGRAGTGTGIMGLFNVDRDAKGGGVKNRVIKVDEFPGVYHSNPDGDGDDDGAVEVKYIVRAHRTGIIAEDLTPSSTLSISLNPSEDGWEILTVYPSPIYRFQNLSTRVSVLGLLRKMTGAAALVSTTGSVQTNGRLRIDISLKALGVLGIYFSELRNWDIDERFMVLISGQAVPRRTVWKEDKTVLAIDVEEAWDSMGLEAGWSNEVNVSVLV